ncbi:Dihydropteroate synthase [hydrothermal vent metagenome]|uniref:dihydropteroate synthase n=1 Tax=hydrothermal vent metagenome TaxID=652676 RepID=A0A1W1DHN3_9ZZZZ
MQISNPMIMGVLNITPDSFSDGGKHLKTDAAIKQAQLMVSQGADIIDIGGESTRPGAQAVSDDDELNRVIPVIEALSDMIDTPISIDTSKPEVMAQAVNAGASLINDVSALQTDGALQMAASLSVDVCLMHMQGSPRTMQNNPVYADVIDDIKHFFTQRIEACINAGINEDKILLDPGFGFGKALEHNLEILKRLAEFKSFGLPVLAGISRKSMIGTLLNNRNVEGRVVGSVTAAIIAVQNGADIVRVHDVLETKDALVILQSVIGD